MGPEGGDALLAEGVVVLDDFLFEGFAGDGAEQGCNISGIVCSSANEERVAYFLTLPEHEPQSLIPFLTPTFTG